MNLLNLIQENLPPQAVSQASAVLGETPEATRTAFSTAFTALLGKLVGDAFSGTGATELFGRLNPAKPQQGWPGSAATLLNTFPGVGSNGSGNSLVSSLLGSKASSVTDFIAGRSGVKASSALSILGMAGPLLMGTLSKLVSSQSLGATALGQLLRSQASHLGGIFPAGLANTLGIGKLVPVATDPARAAASSPQTASAGTLDRVRAGSVRAADALSSNLGILRRALVPLVLILGALLAFHQLWKNAPATGGTADQTYSTTQTSQLNLTGLHSLNLTPGSIADRMARAISSAQLSKPVELSSPAFHETGELTQAAQGDLAEVATVIREVPGLNVTAAAYGKTTEEGLGRANEIKSILVAKGAPAGRIKTKGAEGRGSPQLILSK